MARAGQMTARRFQLAKDGKLPHGMHPDGAGLYAQVTKGGASWIYRYRVDTKRIREMGLGSLDLYSLAEARALALDARRLRHQGIDPIEHRRAARAQAKLESAKAMTFQECADAYVASHRPSWRSNKHAAQWETTLREYAGPIIGALPVQSIDTALVLKVLQQPVEARRGEPAGEFWQARRETASRLRGRIESILDWAKVRGYRAGENPARWRGHLDILLPARSKVRQIEHHPALPYSELPHFLIELREREGIAARALEFTILTAARVGEVLGARWREFNLLDKTWTVPGERMKAGKDHRVPLSNRALAILEAMRNHRTGDDSFVFPSSRSGLPLSDWSLRDLVTDRSVTVHGFRSSFSDWAHERSSYPNHVIELSLAHNVGNAVERAYRRTDLFEQRRRLMDEWARYCTQPAPLAGEQTGSVLPLRAG